MTEQGCEDYSTSFWHFRHQINVSHQIIEKILNTKIKHKNNDLFQLWVLQSGSRLTKQVFKLQSLFCLHCDISPQNFFLWISDDKGEAFSLTTKAITIFNFPHQTWAPPLNPANSLTYEQILSRQPWNLLTGFWDSPKSPLISSLPSPLHQQSPLPPPSSKTFWVWRWR